MTVIKSKPKRPRRATFPGCYLSREWKEVAWKVLCGVGGSEYAIITLHHSFASRVRELSRG